MNFMKYFQNLLSYSLLQAKIEFIFRKCGFTSIDHICYHVKITLKDWESVLSNKIPAIVTSDD